MIRIAFLLVTICILIISEIKAGIILIDQSNLSQRMFFAYHNKFGDEIRSTALEMDGPRSKSWKINSSCPLLINFSTDFKIFPILAFPGDTIRIILKNDSLDKYVSFQGNRSFEEMNFFLNLEKQIGFVVPEFALRTFSENTKFDLLKNQIDEVNKRRLELLNSTKYLSQEFTDYTRFLLRTGYYIDLLSPYYNYEANNYDLSIISKSYINSLYGIRQFMEENPKVDQYKYQILIWNYNKFLLRVNPQHGDGFEGLLNTSLYELSGEVRNFVLFRLLKENCNKGVFNFDEYVSHFRLVCSNNSYVSYIDSLKFNYTKILTDPVIQSETLLDLENNRWTWADILEHFKNEMIVVDFWASWCNPCIEQIKECKDSVMDRQGKGVVFIYISIDEDHVAWKSAIGRWSISNTGDNHFILPIGSYFAEALPVPPIPKYLILSKSRTVIVTDAPKPCEIDFNRYLER